MYEKTNFLCLTMQRYEEKPSRENMFNESPSIFSKYADLYFINTFWGLNTGLIRGMRNSSHL